MSTATLYRSPPPFIALAAALALSACVSEPTRAPPPPPAPTHWQAPDTLAGPVTGDWLQDFADPALTALVDEALAHNHDLAAAAARLASARARARIAGAPPLPQAELGLEASRGTSRGAPSPGDDFGLEARVSWEADLWGRLGDAARASALEAAATEQELRAARLSLAAGVARGWFALIEATQQERLARHTLESFHNTLEVIQARYRRGLDGALEVRLARSDLASAQATLAARRRDRDAATRSLEVLLGRYPGAALTPPPELPQLAGPVPAGLPSRLLARRPDLVAAERRLRAAGARLDEARANRLPRLQLTARGGTAGDRLRELLDWDNLVWDLLAGLTQPLFQGGRLEAEQALAQAGHEEAWAGYAEAVLSAFREVETALDAEARYREQEQALAEATREAREAERLARERYRQGLADIVTLLESRRRAFTAESGWLRVARERLDSRVTLYLALGGGFGSEEPPDCGGGTAPGGGCDAPVHPNLVKPPRSDGQ